MVYGLSFLLGLVYWYGIDFSTCLQIINVLEVVKNVPFAVIMGQMFVRASKELFHLFLLESHNKFVSTTLQHDHSCGTFPSKGKSFWRFVAMGSWCEKYRVSSTQSF